MLRNGVLKTWAFQRAREKYQIKKDSTKKPKNTSAPKRGLVEKVDLFGRKYFEKVPSKRSKKYAA